MGIFDTFRRSKPEVPAAESEAKTSLQLLFASPLQLETETLTRSIRAYDSSLRAAKVTITGGEEAALGEVSWQGHAVQIVVLGAPMPAPVVEICVAPAPYDESTKALARAHGSHALLFYRGQSQNVLEQYVALALVASVLCGEGAIAVLNEIAHASMPASVFVDEAIGPKRAEFLRTLPPLYLYAGFVKYEIENASGVWMRTHGLELWDLPDLATNVESHARGQEIFEIFSNVAAYMMDKGPVLSPGHSMQIGEELYMKLREPGIDEAPLQSENALLIAEFIRPDEANTHVFTG